MANRSKLVRDKIPNIIGPTAKFHIAEYSNEYLGYLLAKLDEEVAEYKESGEIEELADILEVIRALALQEHGITWVELKKIQARKYFERGGFDGRIILDIDNRNEKDCSLEEV